MKKILVTILCFIETFVMSNFALAEENNMSTYNLYINSIFFKVFQHFIVFI